MHCCLSPQQHRLCRMPGWCRIGVLLPWFMGRCPIVAARALQSLCTPNKCVWFQLWGGLCVVAVRHPGNCLNVRRRGCLCWPLPNGQCRQMTGTRLCSRSVSTLQGPRCKDFARLDLPPHLQRVYMLVCVLFASMWLVAKALLLQDSALGYGRPGSISCVVSHSGCAMLGAPQATSRLT